MWQRKLIKNFLPLWWWCCGGWVWFYLVLMGFLCGFCGFDGSLMWVLLALGLLGFWRVVPWQILMVVLWWWWCYGGWVWVCSIFLWSFWCGFLMRFLKWILLGFLKVVLWCYYIWLCHGFVVCGGFVVEYCHCGGILPLWSMLREEKKYFYWSWCVSIKNMDS